MAHVVMLLGLLLQLHDLLFQGRYDLVELVGMSTVMSQAQVGPHLNLGSLTVYLFQFM